MTSLRLSNQLFQSSLVVLIHAQGAQEVRTGALDGVNALAVGHLAAVIDGSERHVGSR